MNIDHQKLRYISGPVSVIKLEGTINKTKKEILIFGDLHYRENQNECESIDSVSIKSYLIDLFKKSEQKLDFFLELKDDLSKKEEIPFTANYLNQLRFFFVKNKNNFRNVRFHYSDIRDVNRSDFLMFIYGLKDSRYENIINSNVTRYDDLLYILYLSDEIKEYVNIIIKGLKLNPKSFKKLLDDEPDDSHKFIFIKNIYKILNKYNNKSIKKEIRKILKLLTSKSVKDVNELIKFVKPIKKKVEDKILFSASEIEKNVFNLRKKIENLRTTFVYLFSLITDIYTLRRILDKNYVDKSIIYVGAAHAKNLLNILVSNFNFKVINKFSYRKDLINIEKNFLLDFFKNRKKESNNKKQFDSDGFVSEITKQCIDIQQFKKPLI
tara:strand:+ start:357 stop:1499 length:1143 start_codon:yes stop_codon:yes gene_type:complete